MSSNHETLRQFHSESSLLTLEGREILLGRALAAWLHPFAAWRLCAASWRVWIVVAYAATGYFVVLSLLLLLNPR